MCSIHWYNTLSHLPNTQNSLVFKLLLWFETIWMPILSFVVPTIPIKSVTNCRTGLPLEITEKPETNHVMSASDNQINCEAKKQWSYCSEIFILMYYSNMELIAVNTHRRTSFFPPILISHMMQPVPIVITRLILNSAEYLTCSHLTRST